MTDGKILQSALADVDCRNLMPRIPEVIESTQKRADTFTGPDRGVIFERGYILRSFLRAEK